MDLALNHGAGVILVGGRLADFWFLTDLAGSAKRSAEHGTRLVFPKSEDKLQESMDRLLIWRAYLRRHLRESRPEYVGIEDYALEGGAHGGHYKGELGGLARAEVLDVGAGLRLHDPGSVKMFATYNGNADKTWVAAAVKERWGADFSEFDPPRGKSTKKNPKGTDNHQTSEDLCDAYAVARLVWTEVLLRAGKLRLDELHKKEIQVFNRVTKSYPVNLLGREWIRRIDAD